MDGRADVYSLGVMLYELLTRQRPFVGTARMVLQQVLHEEPRRPRAVHHRVPRDLETICLKAMAKEPPRRYATAGDLAADLRRWLGDEPIQARPAGRIERTWRWCRRNRLKTAALLMLLAGGIATATAAVVFSRLADRETAVKSDLHRTLSAQYVASGTRALDANDYGIALLWFAQALELDEHDSERAPAHRRGWPTPGGRCPGSSACTATTPP